MGPDINSCIDNVSRRRLLKGAAGIGVVGIAGCSGGGEQTTVDPVQNRTTVDPDEITEGGTIRVGMPVNVDTFDVPYSTSASASAVHGLLFEGLITVGADGQIYPWLAESVERVDIQDISREAYTEYMRSVQYIEGENRPVLDVDQQIVVRAPDAPESPTVGDETQVLTVADTQAAVDDDVYGMFFQAQLHEGVEFHNGEELTATNVVDSYYRYANSPNAGQIFDSLLHVEAAGEYTVNFYSQIPDAAALRELGGLAIYPTESTDLPPRAMDPREGNTPLGTGPWELAEFENDQFIRFTRVDDYWFETGLKDWFDGPENFPNGPVIDEVFLEVVQDDATRSAALQNDEIDMTYGLTADDLTTYQEADGFRTAATNGAGFTFMQYPVNSEPWDDPRVRRAINHLIPRDRIVNNIFQGWEAPAWTPLPQLAADVGTTDYQAQIEDHRPMNTYDPERAGELIEAVIEERDLSVPIEVTFETNSDSDDRVRTMELITEFVNQTEYFNASLETREFLDLVRELNSGQYGRRERIVMIGLSGGFDPHGYAKALHSPENIGGCCNFQRINIAALNDALENARYGVDVAQDPDLRRQRYETVWDIVMEQMANSYTTHSITTSVLTTEVVGFNTYPSTQGIIDYGLYAPADQQVTYLDRN